jgi:uncharacterized protein with NRDE domain
VCTVLVRIDPQSPWPVLLGAIRDEFVERPWDPPGRHWPHEWAELVGGRDRQAGGTWLAVDPRTPAVAALLNGGRREEHPDGATRPTRGTLALRALSPRAGDAGPVPDGVELEAYDRFHLLRATAAEQELWSWDGESMRHVALDPGLHIIVNGGLDVDSDPLVPHFAPLLAEVLEADLAAGHWGGWPALLTGDGLPGDDERALVVEKVIEGHAYGSTSGALVALSADGAVRYDFTATPADAASWDRVL